MTTTPVVESTFRAAVAQAVRAPSMYNAQPWRFVLLSDAVELCTDPLRQVPVADPTGWASRIACGAALLNLRLSLAAVGRPVRVELMPAPSRPDLVATLTPLVPRPPTPNEAALAAAIGRRRSNRGPFHETPVPAAARTSLAAAASEQGAALMYAADPLVLADISELIRIADRQLTQRPGYADELRSWMRTDPAATDGIVRAAAGPEPGPTELVTRRDFGGPPAPENRRYEATPLLAVLAAPGDTPRDQVNAGQALQRVLLAATQLGLSCSLVSQPIEVSEIRERLRARMASQPGVPQMVLRLGYGTPVPPTGRRPVDEVCIVHAGQRP